MAKFWWLEVSLALALHRHQNFSYQAVTVPISTIGLSSSSQASRAARNCEEHHEALETALSSMDDRLPARCPADVCRPRRGRPCRLEERTQYLSRQSGIA